MLRREFIHYCLFSAVSGNVEMWCCFINPCVFTFLCLCGLGHILKGFLYPALRQKLAAFTALGVTESRPVQ